MTSSIPSPTTTSPVSGEVVLLPCPFCGGEAHLQENGTAGSRYWEVVCYEPCDFCGPAHDTQADAIAAWNCRVPPHPPIPTSEPDHVRRG